MGQCVPIWVGGSLCGCGHWELGEVLVCKLCPRCDDFCYLIAFDNGVVLYLTGLLSMLAQLKAYQVLSMAQVLTCTSVTQLGLIMVQESENVLLGNSCLEQCKLLLPMTGQRSKVNQYLWGTLLILLSHLTIYR